MAQATTTTPKTKATTRGKHGTSPPKTAEVIKEFTQTTGRVVRQAADILEEEVAAGISAVKKLEEGFVNVGELRAEEKDQVLQRFRRDAHEVVDIALDVLSTATRYMADLAGDAVKIRSGSRRDGGKTNQSSIPTVGLTQPVSPGGTSEVVMTLENSSPDQDTEFSFMVTDLINDGGATIRASNIGFKPAKVVMAPGETTDVTIVVTIPKSASKGLYTGLIRASRWQQLRAVLVAEVE